MTDSRKAANDIETGDLRLVAGFDRTLIRRKGESVRFLVAEVTAPTVGKSADAVRVPLNLALVIDASGSMHGEPIAAAKEAARLVVGNLGADDRLSVVAFDTHVRLLVDGRLQDAAGKAAATLAIAQLEAGSSTNLGGGWLQGCTSVAKVMEARGGQGLRNRVVVLSDGQANVGMVEPDELSDHSAKLRARGLVSSAVGIGESYSDTQLEAIAASGGGSLHHASLPQEIVELVLGELDEVRETVVESCELVLETPVGFRAELVGDLATTREGDRLTTVLGALGSGASRALVVKVSCGAGERRSEALVKVLARYRNVGKDRIVETAAIECRLQFATGKECLAQPRDKDRALTVATMWQFAIVRAATRLNQDGELARANELVEKELIHFRRYSQGLPGAASMLEALERMQRSIGDEVYAPMMAKEMRIASTKGLRRVADHRPMASPAAMWHSHLPPAPRK